MNVNDAVMSGYQEEKKNLRYARNVKVHIGIKKESSEQTAKKRNNKGCEKEMEKEIEIEQAGDNFDQKRKTRSPPKRPSQ